MGILGKAAKAAAKAAKAAKAAAADKTKPKTKPKAKKSPNTKYVGSGPISEVVEGKKTKTKAATQGKNRVSEAEKKDQAKKATGRITAKNTKPGPKPLSMSKYRSFTDAQRAKAKAQAGIDFRAGKITKAERDTIVKRIDAANAAEVDKGGRKMAQGKADKKPFKGYTPKSPFNKGGMAKKNTTAYMYGGMAKKKAKK